jgi:hypothetical protein
MPTGLGMPTITVETGLSETYHFLRRDVDVWPRGGAGMTNICLLINLNTRVETGLPVFWKCLGDRIRMPAEPPLGSRLHVVWHFASRVAVSPGRGLWIDNPRYP